MNNHLVDRASMLLAGLALLVLVCVTAPATAQLPAPGKTIIAGGDEQALWVVQPDVEEKYLSVLHRLHIDEPLRLRKALRLQGRLATAGITTIDGELWLAYQESTVQSIRAYPQSDVDPWRFRTLTRRSLPKGTLLRSIDANQQGTWALLRVEDVNALPVIDDLQIPTSDAGEPAREAETAGVPVDRLLRLTPLGWRKFPLPENWQQGREGWVVSPRATSDYPWLIVRVAETGDTGTLRVYSFTPAGKPSTSPQPAATVPADKEATTDADNTADGENISPAQAQLLASLAQMEQGTWTSWDARLAGSEPLQFASVQGQLVVAQRTQTSDKVSLRIAVVRPEGVFDLGTLELQGRTPIKGWSLVNAGTEIGVVTVDDNAAIGLALMSLQGHVVQPHTELQQNLTTLSPASTHHLILIGIMTISILLMFIFWRRDPAWSKVELPAQYALADVSARAIAAVIDLAPCLVLAMLIYRKHPLELLSQWPNFPGGWDVVLPNMVALGIYVLYGFLSELFTARTLGKSVMNLRVTGLKGEPPNLWQVLIRNVLKALEIVAWPLLIMPIVGVSHQRLGDMIARTLVVSPAEPQQPAGNDADE